MNILNVTKEENLATLMLQQLPVIVANDEVLGVDASLLDEFNTAYNQFNASIGAAATAKAAAKAAVTTKNNRKQTARNLLRTYAKVWRANPAVTDELLDKLFLAPKETPATSTPPTTPTQVTFEATGGGLVTLRWKRNGNIQGTTFLVQTASSATGEWTTFGTTTKTKFEYTGTPGQGVWFRIIASRDSQSSQPTLPVSVWVGDGESTLELAA